MSARAALPDCDAAAVAAPDERAEVAVDSDDAPELARDAAPEDEAPPERVPEDDAAPEEVALLAPEDAVAPHSWDWRASAAWTSAAVHDCWRHVRACCWKLVLVQTQVMSVTPLQPAAVAAWEVQLRIQGESPVVEVGAAALALVLD